MKLTVTISRASVMEEVYRITGYTGVKNRDMDGLSSTEDDAGVLASYYKEGTGALSDVVSRVGCLSEENDDSSEFTFTLPANWNISVESSLTKAMTQYVVNYVCAKWFNLMKKDETAYYGGVCDKLAAAVVKYLYERKRPVLSES